MTTDQSILLLIADLNAQTRTLQAENAELRAENAELRERLTHPL